MSDEGQELNQGGGVLKYVAIGVALVYVIASLYLMFDMRGRINTLEQKQTATELAQKDLGQKLHATNTTVQESVQALGSKVGMTQEELAKKTSELRRQQAASEQ